MTDSAFVGAGKKAGMELWRIEKLAPVKQANVNGKFHVGDSYILLVTTQQKAGGAFSWAIHFWLGSETSSDEAGCAAYKTVELDESLGGGPVQYREVQGSESQLFLSYFKNSGGVEYLPGGVESGFRHVEQGSYRPRLLHLKGKRTVRVNEVPISASSLNNGDVFVLDLGLKIFLFNGANANRSEKSKGVEVAHRIDSDERGGKAEVILLDDEPQNAEFWGHFGGYTSSLPDGDRDSLVAEIKIPRKLFKISDASGSLEFVDITPADGKLKKELLDTNDVFLVQSPAGKLFIWVGKKSNSNEKKEATVVATKHLTKANLPASTPIERVSEGNESGTFKGEFSLWDAPQSFGTKAKAATESGDSPANVQELLARKATEDAPVDDGSGNLKVWVIKDFKKVEVDPSEYGQFYGGDSYILLYTYTKNRSEEYIIYFWLGNDSTADEKGAAALLTVELDDSLGGKPVQIRVTQGKEPAHFRQLFKGKMVVYKGGNASGFAKGANSVEQDDVALFHVKGTTALNTMALQVNNVAASLNSEDSFVLVTPSHVYTWFGSKSNESEHDVATSIATILAGKYKGTSGRLVVPANEHAEPDEFWAALGGRGDYAQSAPGEAVPREARLFSASTATGRFKVEEIDNFDQHDLNDEDVFLLDTYTQLFVWIGSQSSEEEKKKAVEFAGRFIAEADDGRDHDIPVIRVSAGQEPTMFSSHFFGWDAEYTKKQIYVDPYQAKLEALSAQKKTSSLNTNVTLKKVDSPVKAAPAPAPAPAAAPATAPAPTPAASSAPKTAAAPGSYSYEQLKTTTDGIDVTQKEEYLSDAEFQSVFGMDRAAFRAMPKWKRDDAKKKKGLF